MPLQLTIQEKELLKLNQNLMQIKINTQDSSLLLTLYREIQRVQAPTTVEVLTYPCVIFCLPVAGGSGKEDSRPKETVVQEQLLLTLESAYPNIMPAEDLAQCVTLQHNFNMKHTEIMLFRLLHLHSCRLLYI